MDRVLAGDDRAISLTTCLGLDGIISCPQKLVTRVTRVTRKRPSSRSATASLLI